jgi:hypothetical protein
LVAYPAFVTMFVAAVPQYSTWVSALRHNVPVNEWQIARENARLWSENLDCTARPPQKVIEHADVKVTALVCPNADVLVGVSREGRSSLRWIGHDTLKRASLETPGVAHADEAAPTAAGGEVLCQKKEKSDRVLRRVRREDGTCRDEVVNIYTGRVKDRGEAPCDPDCTPR